MSPARRTPASRAFTRIQGRGPGIRPMYGYRGRTRFRLLRMGRAVSLLREFRVAAAPARHAIAVSREEHPRAALRTVCSLPCDPVAVNLVELPLEAGRAFLLLRFGHHFASFFLPSGFLSAFFSSLFSSFFSAGFFSSFAAGFFFSLSPALSRFGFRFSSSLRAPSLCPGGGGAFPCFR